MRLASAAWFSPPGLGLWGRGGVGWGGETVVTHRVLCPYVSPHGITGACGDLHTTDPASLGKEDT